MTNDYSRDYDKAVRYSKTESTKPTEPEYQQLEAEIHKDPKEATTHLAAADWAAENGYPQEADFRKKMAEWVQRPGDNQYNGGDGNSSFGLRSHVDRNYPYSHTVHRKNLPDWAADHVKKSASFYGDQHLTDPAVASSPVGVNYNWTSYPDMEEGLRRAHADYTATKKPEGA